MTQFTPVVRTTSSFYECYKQLLTKCTPKTADNITWEKKTRDVYMKNRHTSVTNSDWIPTKNIQMGGLFSFHMTFADMWSRKAWKGLQNKQKPTKSQIGKSNFLCRHLRPKLHRAKFCKGHRTVLSLDRATFKYHNHFQEELWHKINLNTSTTSFSAHSFWCVLCIK